MNAGKILFFILLVASDCLIGTNCYEPEIAEGVNPCDAAQSCSNLGAGVQVPDPESCRSYYLCISETTGEVIPSDSPLPCPENQYFNVDSLQCEDETDTCYRPCLNVFCNFECNLNATDSYFLADPNSCNDYFVCVPGTGSFPSSCPPIHPYFNGVDCGNLRVECCEGCIPYCHNVSIETRDPLDCRKYYICTEIGVPDDSFHFNCNVGFYFDNSLGACVFGDTCTPLCSSSGLTTTFTPTTTSTPTPITTTVSTSSTSSQ